MLRNEASPVALLIRFFAIAQNDKHKNYAKRKIILEQMVLNCFYLFSNTDHYILFNYC